MPKEYIFQSARLGFRGWSLEDLDKMAAINANKAVMEFFPSTQTKEKTRLFIERMQKQLEEKQFCYFAVDKLEDQTLIGFIGISEQTFESDFTPCIDIGWRLDSQEWGKGFASEGAKRCLEYAQTVLEIEEICAVAPIVNTKSIRVMEKIGLQKKKTFQHPLLGNSPHLQECALYSI